MMINFENETGETVEIVTQEEESPQTTIQTPDYTAQFDKLIEQNAFMIDQLQQQLNLQTESEQEDETSEEVVTNETETTLSDIQTAILYVDNNLQEIKHHQTEIDNNVLLIMVCVVIWFTWDQLKAWRFRSTNRR